MKSYSAFGLHIISDIPFGIPVTDSSPPDITISEGEVQLESPAGLNSLSPFAACSRDRLWQMIPGLIRMTATKDKIVWQVDKHVTQSIVSEFLLHLALPFVLVNRGYFIRTGTAVDIHGNIVILPGLSQFDSAWITGTLVKGGAGYFSEGMCAVRTTCKGGFEVLPGTARIRSGMSSRWNNTNPLVERFQKKVPVGWYEQNMSFRSKPMPLTHIVYQETGENVQAASMKEMNDLEKLKKLITGQHLPDYPMESSSRKDFWDLHMAMIGTVKMYRVFLADGKEKESMADTLLEYFS